MKEFLRYLASAGAASCADFVVAQSLLSVFYFHSNWGFGICVASGALVGMGFYFVLSRGFVFDAGQVPLRGQALRFILVSVSTLILRVFTGYLLLVFFSTPIFSWVVQLPIDAAGPRLSQAGAMGLVTIYSFFAHKHFSFSTPAARLGFN